MIALKTWDDWLSKNGCHWKYQQPTLASCWLLGGNQVSFVYKNLGIFQTINTHWHTVPQLICVFDWLIVSQHQLSSVTALCITGTRLQEMTYVGKWWHWEWHMDKLIYHRKTRIWCIVPEISPCNGPPTSASYEMLFWGAAPNCVLYEQLGPWHSSKHDLCIRSADLIITLFGLIFRRI